MIYWIEHAPNPWVRAVAVGILGGIAVFNWWSGANVPNIATWLGGYGACNDWNDGDTVPEFAGGKRLSKDAELMRRLCASLGPVSGIAAFREMKVTKGKQMTDTKLVQVMAEAFPKPKARKALKARN